MLLTLREAEYREKTRCDELRGQYVDECHRRRLPVEDVELTEPIAMRYDPTTGHLMAAADPQLYDGAGAPASSTSTGNAQLLASLIREQQRKNREMQMTADQVESRMRKLMIDYDAALEAFAVKAGSSHSNGSSVQLLEEVIALLTESDASERSLLEEDLKALHDACRHAEAMRTSLESFEREKIAVCRDIEARQDELRALEVQLLCAGNAAGLASDVSSLEDEANVLTSKIAMIENEIRIIRKEQEAAVKVRRELDARVVSSVAHLERAAAVAVARQ
jgi:hypothetical protein